MSDVVADTHAVLWYIDSPAQLSVAATRAMDTAANTVGERIYISAITLVEISYLVEKGRINLAVRQLVEAEIKQIAPRLVVCPLDSEVAAALNSIPRAIVADMPDRIVAATAFYLGLPLVSADSQIQQLSNISVVW